MIFLCFYLGEGKEFALMHVYKWDQIICLYYRTAWWIFTKLGRDEVFIALHICPWADPGQDKNGPGVQFLKKNIFRVERYRNKPNA